MKLKMRLNREGLETLDDSSGEESEEEGDIADEDSNGGSVCSSPSKVTADKNINYRRGLLPK